MAQITHTQAESSQTQADAPWLPGIALNVTALLSSFLPPSLPPSFLLFSLPSFSLPSFLPSSLPFFLFFQCTMKRHTKQKKSAKGLKI